MTRQEFEQRVKDEKLKMKDFDIALDNYYDGHPYIMGCISKDGKWVIYETDERSGNAYIIKEFETEENAFDYFYEYVNCQIESENLASTIIKKRLEKRTILVLFIF